LSKGLNFETVFQIVAKVIRAAVVVEEERMMEDGEDEVEGEEVGAAVTVATTIHTFQARPNRQQMFRFSISSKKNCRNKQRRRPKAKMLVEMEEHQPEPKVILVLIHCKVEKYSYCYDIRTNFSM
jgi:hypothetical protein